MSPVPVLIALSCSLILIGCTGSKPLNLGVHDGKLLPCPASPNCVSSLSLDRKHGIEPLQVIGSGRECLAALAALISGMKRTRIVTQADSYVHAEFTSALFRFVDDVEFLLDERAGVIHVRSASRIGYSDLGANRRRVENIRAAMHALPSH